MTKLSDVPFADLAAMMDQLDNFKQRMSSDEWTATAAAVATEMQRRYGQIASGSAW